MLKQMTVPGTNSTLSLLTLAVPGVAVLSLSWILQADWLPSPGSQLVPQLLIRRSPQSSLPGEAIYHYLGPAGAFMPLQKPFKGQFVSRIAAFSRGGGEKRKPASRRASC